MLNQLLGIYTAHAGEFDDTISVAYATTTSAIKGYVESAFLPVVVFMIGVGVFAWVVTKISSRLGSGKKIK